MAVTAHEDGPRPSPGWNWYATSFTTSPAGTVANTEIGDPGHLEKNTARAHVQAILDDRATTENCAGPAERWRTGQSNHVILVKNRRTVDAYGVYQHHGDPAAAISPLVDILAAQAGLTDTPTA